MSHIYLDANSTTHLDIRVRQSIEECYEAQYVNPASQHRPGQIARRQIEIARCSIAESLGAASKDRLIFTSGGTEANNLAVIGLAGGVAQPSSSDGSAAPEIIVSSIEHPSVLGAADFLTSRGFVVRQIPVDHWGYAQIESLRELINPNTRLVSLMMANNETGVIQDVATAVEICRESGVLMHCDAVQAVGKIPFRFDELGLSALTLTAHKLHGPRGVGGLLLGENIDLQPITFGGFQQLGQRPGTEDVALATGFAKAVDLMVESTDRHASQMLVLRDLFESTILEALPQTVINGVGKPRLPHTSNLSFPGSLDESLSDQLGFSTVNRQALLMAADAAGVAISTGSACASGSSEPSHVLSAMGVDQAVLESSIRVSFSIQSSRQEVLEGARRIINAVKHLRHQKSGRK